jgi:hypothetical protein
VLAEVLELEPVKSHGSLLIPWCGWWRAGTPYVGPIAMTAGPSSLERSSRDWCVRLDRLGFAQVFETHRHEPVAIDVGRHDAALEVIAHRVGQ